MRLPSLRMLAVLVPAVLALSAAPASAGVNSWTGLTGLNAASGSSWVREYATGMPPTTIYAATEGSGVYRSTNDGLTWQSFSSGLENVPGAKDVRTVFTSGATAYAGTSAGLFKSVGGGWTPVAQGAEEDPKDPKKLNAAVQAVLTGTGGSMLAGVASGGVYKSGDGGATWKPPAPGNGMARSETVWSLVEFIPGVVFAATSSGMYRSTDFGSTWTLTNDGISGSTLRAFKDEKAPNIYYAAGSDGVFRTRNAGITWSKINGPSGHTLPGGPVRALKQFTGVDLTRLYAGTIDGVYAGTTDHGPFPGEVKWRKVTNSGLGDNTIVWALTSFLTTPGTLLAGTQSNGGYALTFTPAVNTVPPTINDTAPLVGEILTAMNGTWTGTPTVEFEYQWQRCTTASTGSCSDVEDATEKTFVVPSGSIGMRWRVQVTGVNDFPTFGLNEVSTALTGTTGAAAGPLPGTAQSAKASVGVDAPGDSGQPQSGDTLRAKQWLFNPAADLSTTFQWSRCIGVACEQIDRATAVTYQLKDADVGYTLCVAVTGRNDDGATTLDCGGQSNTVLSEDPKQLTATTLKGTAYVGDTLISGVGSWKTATTTYTRQWESCNAGGGSCQTISNEKSANYKVRPADLGQRLRVRITADTNGPNNNPAPAEVFTPLSGVVTLPPAPPADPSPTPESTPTPTPQGGNNQDPGPQPTPGPAPDTAAPVLQSASAVSAKLKPGAPLKLKVGVSEAGSLSVELQRVKSGRKVGKTCKAGAKKGKKCTVITKIATVKVAGVGGSGTVTLPKRKLATGDYRAVVTPIDAAGNRGKAKTIAFKVTRK